MKIGVTITDFSWPAPITEIGPRVARLARAADQAGFDSLWTMDHLFQISLTGLPPESPMPEGYTTLGFLAGQTERIQLGTLVTSVSYRHPGVLVKMVTTLDVLTGGRMVLGVGAGAPVTRWALDGEAGGLGIPFPSLAERFERLEELLQIAHRMWAGDESPFDGAHYQLARPLNSPNSIQRPHPSILIGGSGEAKTLPLVARYADACNLFDLPGTGFRDDLRHKLRVLREHCDAVGRDYDEIEKTTATLFGIDDDPEAAVRQLVDHLAELAAVGIDHAIISPRFPWDDRSLAALAAAVPEIHDLQVSTISA